MRKTRSRPDALLAILVTNQVGFEVSGWEIERWRQAGLVRPANHEYPGRGSRSYYGPDAAQDAAIVATLMRRHRSIRKVARILFLRGLYVREDTLRRALMWGLAGVEKWIGPMNTDAERDRAYKKAERLAAGYARRTMLGKRILRGLRGRRVAASALAPDVYYNLMHIMKTGEPAPDHDLSDLLETTGLVGLISERLGGLGPIAPGDLGGIRRWFRDAHLTNVQSVLARSSIGDLEAARDLLLHVLAVLKDLATLLLKLYPGTNALGMAMLAEADIDEALLAGGIPFGLLLLPHVRTDTGKVFMDAVERNREILRRQAEFANLLSPAALTAIRTGDSQAFAELPLEEQELIRTAGSALLADGA